MDMQQATQSKEYLSIGEVSKLFGVSTSWLYKQVAAQKIPHAKLGRLVRFSRAELSAWFQKLTGGGEQ